MTPRHRSLIPWPRSLPGPPAIPPPTSWCLSLCTGHDLPLVERGLPSTGASRAGVVGMWQFMGSTGRLDGLAVDPWVDERRDPERAPQAAVNYLAGLRERLGGVYLPAAAYNTGVGRNE